MIELAAPGRPRLPVGKIVAVGRNYADHVREMAAGAAPRFEPVLFLKPPSALVVPAEPGAACAIELPPFARLVHHEVELVVRVGRGGRRLDPAQARAALDAFGIGLDLTARDLQNLAKERGEPWAVAKGFDDSAPLSPLVALEPAADRDADSLPRLEVALAVNGVERQRAPVAAMLLPIPELVAFVSSRFRLEPGDLIFTGTPAGVGPVAPGDRLLATAGEPGRREVARLEVEVRGAA